MKNKALIQVFTAIFLAILAGYLTGSDKAIFGVTFLQLYTLIGQLFLNALTLVVVPLVASSIILGAARIGGEGSLGNLGLKTFGYFILTTLIAIAIGFITVTLIEPGVAQTPPQVEITAAQMNKLAESVVAKL